MVGLKNTYFSQSFLPQTDCFVPLVTFEVGRIVYMKLIVLSVPILIHINQVANGLGIVLIQGQVPCVKVRL